jgi:hypothetical protein
MSGIVQTVRNKQQRRHEKVNENTKFDYYYGIEADQFSFYRVPRLLIKDERFKGLSSDAKLLYGLMLMSKNQTSQEKMCGRVRFPTTSRM